MRVDWSLDWVSIPKVKIETRLEFLAWNRIVKIDNQATWLTRLERILSLNCQELESNVMESSHVINSGFRDQSKCA